MTMPSDPSRSSPGAMPGHETRNSADPASEVSTPPRRVLVVDDDLNVTRLVKWALERSGRYSVESLNRAADAVAAARRHRPDLIILDVKMPEIEGPELAAMLRQQSDL